MKAPPEGHVQARSPSSAVPSSTLAGSTAEAVDRILARTEAEVASIRARTEQQVRQIAADLEAQALEEASQRRARLEQLRHELASRASTLTVAYQAINQQLQAVESALAGLAPEAESRRSRVNFEQTQEQGRITLRERRRIDVPYDDALASVPAPVVEQQQAPAPPPADLAQHAARRWWRPWQREAA